MDSIRVYARMTGVLLPDDMIQMVILTDSGSIADGAIIDENVSVIPQISNGHNHITNEFNNSVTLSDDKLDLSNKQSLGSLAATARSAIKDSDQLNCTNDLLEFIEPLAFSGNKFQPPTRSRKASSHFSASHSSLPSHSGSRHRMTPHDSYSNSNSHHSKYFERQVVNINDIAAPTSKVVNSHNIPFKNDPKVDKSIVPTQVPQNVQFHRLDGSDSPLHSKKVSHTTVSPGIFTNNHFEQKPSIQIKHQPKRLPSSSKAQLVPNQKNVLMNDAHLHQLQQESKIDKNLGFSHFQQENNPKSQPSSARSQPVSSRNHTPRGRVNRWSNGGIAAIYPFENVSDFSSRKNGIAHSDIQDTYVESGRLQGKSDREDRYSQLYAANGMGLAYKYQDNKKDHLSRSINISYEELVGNPVSSGFPSDTSPQPIENKKGDSHVNNNFNHNYSKQVQSSKRNSGFGSSSRSTTSGARALMLYERGRESRRIKKELAEKEQKAREEKEFEKCTFHPQLMTRSHSQSISNSGVSSSASFHSAAIYRRRNERANSIISNANNNDNTHRVNKDEFNVRPRSHSGANNSSSTVKTPAGYERSVSRLRTANVKRSIINLAHQERAPIIVPSFPMHVGLDSSSPCSPTSDRFTTRHYNTPNGGVTCSNRGRSTSIVLPFQFDAFLSGSPNSHAAKLLEKELERRRIRLAVSKPFAHVGKTDVKEWRAQSPIISGYSDNSFDEKKRRMFAIPPKSERGDLVMHLDVKVPGGKTGRLSLYALDDPARLVRSFAKVFGGALTPEAQVKLYEVACMNLSSYYASASANNNNNNNGGYRVTIDNGQSNNDDRDYDEFGIFTEEPNIMAYDETDTPEYDGNLVAYDNDSSIIEGLN